MAYDFSTNTSSISDLAKQLSDASNNVKAYVDGIYATIDNLKNSWNGTTYDSFKNMCEGYRTTMNALPEILKAFSDIMYGEVTDNAQTFINAVNNGIKEMEG